jgi:hypothetical protein
LGESDLDEEEKKRLGDIGPEDNLKNKSKIAQVFVMLAGIIMNIFLAVTLYLLVLGFNNWKITLASEFADFNPIGAKIVKDVDSTDYVYIDYSGFKIFSGFSHSVNNVRLIAKVFNLLFKEAKRTGDYSMVSQTVSGPVGIFLLVDYFKTLGWIPFISLIADLSLSLAIMNILPIPALDGGRVLIVAIEGILRKDLDPKVEAIIINVSFAILMVFVVLVMIKDIVNIDQLKSLFE